MLASPQLLEGVVTAAAGFVAGGTLYITLVEAPARGKLSPKHQLDHWRTTFPRARDLFKPAGMILVPTLSATAFLTDKRIYYAAAGAFGFMAPFTVAAIAPTNTRLLTLKDPVGEEDNKEISSHIRRWAQRHTVRALFATIGFGFCLYGLSSPTRA